MALLQPEQLTVLTTSQCTAACSHCSMNSAPGRRDRLAFPQVKAALDELHAARPLSVVIFAGGEPTLLGEMLLESIAYADSLGIITRLVTNAVWATTEAKAQQKITELRQAGLAELNVSADDHHLPFVPFENVIHAWRAARSRGFRAVVIANCYGPHSTITPRYVMDRLGEELPARFDESGTQQALPAARPDGTVYMISNSYLQRLGRAKAHVDAADLVWPQHQDALAGGCPWAVRSAALSPRGHLVACCGIEAEGNEILDFGDAQAAGAQTLVERADRSIIINAIALLGPLFLQRFIHRREPSVAFRERYATVCEVCEDVVRRPDAAAALHSHLPALAAAVIGARAAREAADAA